VWVAADVRAAFEHVPLPRLLQVVRHYLPAADLTGLLERVLPGHHLPGLRQGGAVSPLLLNLYLHHLLDHPWARLRPDRPVLRYADDLLLLGRDRAGTVAALEELRRGLDAAGMPIKGDPAVANPATDPVDWLGFRVGRAGDRLTFATPAAAWDSLQDGLAEAHKAADAPLRARGVVAGWLAAQGPSYRWADRDGVLSRLDGLAREQGFDELPPRRDLLAIWARAAGRWEEVRAAAS
jgi:hypothetical protein